MIAFFDKLSALKIAREMNEKTSAESLETCRKIALDSLSIILKPEQIKDTLAEYNKNVLLILSKTINDVDLDSKFNLNSTNFIETFAMSSPQLSIIVSNKPEILSEYHKFINTMNFYISKIQECSRHINETKSVASIKESIGVIQQILIKLPVAIKAASAYCLKQLQLMTADIDLNEIEKEILLNEQMEEVSLREKSNTEQDIEQTLTSNDSNTGENTIDFDRVTESGAVDALEADHDG